MPKPRERASLKKFRKTTTGTKVIFTKAKNSKKKCGLCKNILHGVPHGKTNAQIAKLSKSEKRPETILGGVLCSGCRKSIIKSATMVKYGEMALIDIPVNIRGYVSQILNKIE